MDKIDKEISEMARRYKKTKELSGKPLIWKISQAGVSYYRCASMHIIPGGWKTIFGNGKTPQAAYENWKINKTRK